jgi:CubicO group peptidase (beta-lactamase class C family)
MAEGRLKPTDTIGTLLPDHPNADARAATVQQLLDHRAGIADFFGPTYAAISKDTLRSNSDYYRLVAAQPLTFAPGTRRQYCNGCYVVLGEIITRVSGTPYEAYVTEHVFGPAGMTRSGFLGPDGQQPDVAHGYTRRDSAGSEPRPNTAMVGARGSAAGGAYATAADLARYIGALRGNRLLSPEVTTRLLGGTGEQASMAIAGGAPGLNAVIQASGDIVVVVLANLDPPTAERLGEALARQLAR